MKDNKIAIDMLLRLSMHGSVIGSQINRGCCEPPIYASQISVYLFKFACKYKRTGLVRYIINKLKAHYGVDNLPTNFYNVLIEYACRHGLFDIVKEIDTKCDQYCIEIGLNKAFKGGHLEIINYLYPTYGLNQLYHTDAFGDACKGGNTDVVSYALENLIITNYKYGLYKACEGNHPHIVTRILLIIGIDLNTNTGLDKLCPTCRTNYLSQIRGEHIDTELSHPFDDEDFICFREGLYRAVESAALETAKQMYSYGARVKWKSARAWYDEDLYYRNTVEWVEETHGRNIFGRYESS